MLEEPALQVFRPTAGAHDSVGRTGLTGLTSVRTCFRAPLADRSPASILLSGVMVMTPETATKGGLVLRTSPGGHKLL